MDTYFPYYPREKYTFLAEMKKYREAHKLNEKIGHPFAFMESLSSDEITEDDLEALRELYDYEVKTLDDHLEKILSALDQTGLRDETLIIVTADHGENLGEIDERGNRRMGHHESVSDNLLKVPLVIARPELESRTVTENAETRKIAEVIEKRSLNTDEIIDTLVPDEDYVVVQCPATKSSGRVEEYPNVPDQFFQRHLFEHTVVAYGQEWKVAMISDGGEWAWKNGEDVTVEDAPDELMAACQKYLDELHETEPLNQEHDEDLDDNVANHLADLGYM